MTMTAEPRVCIVGAGKLSRRRIYPYVGAAGARLVGVCDLDQEKAGRNARLYGGAVCSDLDAMLAEQKPDGVVVCITEGRPVRSFDPSTSSGQAARG